MTTLDVYAQRLKDPNLNVKLRVTIAKDLRKGIDVFQTNEYAEFLDKLVPAFIGVLKEVPPTFVSNVPEQQLRNIILEIISRLPQTEHLKKHASELCRLLVQLLRVENEDNALVCVKVIGDLHRTFRVLFDDQVQPFLEVVQEIMQNMEQAVKDTFDAPSTPAGSATPGLQHLLATSPRPMSPATDLEAPAKPLLKGMHSFKVLGECPMLVVLLFQSLMHRRGAMESGADIAKFVPLILGTLNLQAKPQAEAANAANARGEIFVGVSPEIRNRSVYRQFIAAQAKIMSLLIYILRINAKALVPHQAQISDIAIRLLRECPPESSLPRKELLAAMRHILSTDFRLAFVSKLDLLLNEKVLIGTGVTSHDFLRPLAYSMLADLVHHIRANLTPAQLCRTIYMYSRNMHDSTLAPSIQTMCGKLLLNLVERVTKIPNRSEGRALLIRIIDAFASKFEALDTQFQSCLKQYHKKNAASESPKEDFDYDRALPIHTSASLHDSSQNGINDGRFLFKNLATGLESLFTELRKCNPSLLPGQDVNMQFACGFTKDEVNAILRLFRAAILCFEYYNVDNYDNNGLPLSSQTQGLQGDGLLQSSTVDVLLTRKEQPFVKPLADGSFQNTFPQIFEKLDPAVFQEIVESQMEFLFDRMLINPSLIHIVEGFLVNENTSRRFARILVHFLIDRLDQLGDNAASTSFLLLQLFQRLFASVSRSPETHGQILQPHISNLVMSCFKLSAKASAPEYYFLTLRALFKSIGGGRFDALHTEMEPLLQLLLENLNVLITQAHSSQMRDLYVDLCLAVPARLNKLLPYLIRPLVIALQADNELVMQGLHTMELCIDINRKPDFLDQNMAPVMKDLLEGLWKHVKPHPYDEQISHTAIRILGKLSGRNRRTLNMPPSLAFKQRAECGVSMGITFESGTAPRTFSLDILLQISVKTLERADAKQHDHKLAYDFLKANMVLMMDLDTGSDGLAQSLYQRICEQVLKKQDTKPEDDVEVESSKILENSATKSDSEETRLQPKRLPGNGYTKYLSKRVAQEHALQTILVSIMRASTIEALADEAWQFFENICRHFMLLHIGEAIEAREGGSKLLSDMMDERLAVQNLTTTLLVDAVVEAIASDEPRLQERAKEAVRLCFNIATTILGDVENVWQIPIFRVFASQFCSYCYKQEWRKKRGGCLGIFLMSSELEIGTRWMREHELEFVRSLLFVLKDASPEVTNVNLADAIQPLSHVLKVCNQPGDDGSPETQAKFRLLVELLSRELPNSNSVVRDTIRSLFQLLADLTGNDVTELLIPVRDRLLEPIFAKPLRALPIPMQIGHIDAITYCLTLRPPFLEFSDELARLLTEAIALAVADDKALVGNSQKLNNVSSLMKLRIVCIKLLSAAMACSDFANSQAPQRSKIIQVFFRSLHSDSAEVIEAAYRGLKQVLSQQQKLPKDLLQEGLKPTLTQLSQHDKLTVPVLEGLARLLELLTNYFRVEIGNKLLDHLQKWADPMVLQKAADTSIFEKDEDRVIVAILNIFRLLPAAAHIFLGDLVVAVLKIEGHLRRSISSPFRTNLIEYLNRYPTETVAYFYKQLETPDHNQLFIDILSSEKALQVREELIKSPSELINKTFKVVDKPQLHLQGVLIVQAILQFEPNWLVGQPEVLECLLSLWKSPNRFETMKQENEQGTMATRETCYLSKILIAYLHSNENDVDTIFDLLALFVHESVMDLSFLRSFLTNEVALKYSLANRRKIIKHFITVFSDTSASTALKVMALRHVVNPIMLAALVQSDDESQSVLDSDMIVQLDHKVWDKDVWVRAAAESLEENQYMEDSLRVELLQMTTAIVQHAPQLLAELRKNVIMFGWNFLRREDTTTKQAACVLLARFIAAFETPSKIVSHLYSSLLGAHSEESEARILVKQGFDILAPVLPKRVPQPKTEKVPAWVLLTRKKIVEDRHSIPQMVNVYQFLVRHPDLFYDYREHFLPQMVNAIPRLCLLQNSFPEHKLLAVELAEVILKWEKLRLESQGDKKSSVPSKRAATEDGSSPLKKVLTEGAGGELKSTAVETIKEYAPAASLRESVVGYLVRQACAIFNPKDPIHRKLVQRVIELLQEFLTPAVWPDVHVKFYHLERTLTAKDTPEVPVPNVCSALEILNIDIAHKPTEWFIINMNQLSRLLDTSIKSDNVLIQTKLTPVLTRIFRAIHETVSAESTGQESQYPDVVAFVSLVDSTINDGIANMDNLFVVLKLLEAASSSRAERLDAFVPGIVKMLQKLADGRPKGKVEAEAEDSQLVLCLKLLKKRVSHLGDQRRPFLACLAQLIEKPADTQLLREILTMLSEWTLQKTEPFPTIKEKASLLMKLMVLEGCGDRQAAEDYLNLVIKIYNDPTFARSELTVRLEQAFLLGTRCDNPDIRMQFMHVFDRNVGRSPYDRLKYILVTQNWEPISSSFWLHQALDLLFGAIKTTVCNSEPHSLKIKSIKIIGNEAEPLSMDVPAKINEIITQHREFLEDLQSIDTMNLITLAKQLHYLDRNVASQLWVDLFPECWAAITSTERQDLSKMVSQLLSKDYHNKLANQRPNVIQVLLTSFARVETPMKLPPYLVKHLGQTHNAWHTAIEILQQSTTLVRPVDASKDDKSTLERTQDALAEMYSGLNEQDMFYGLWKRRSSYEETKAAILYEQMGYFAEAQAMYEQAQISARSGALPFTESEYMLWEEHWVSCTQKLEQWDLLDDLAEHERNPNLLLECAWRLKDWASDYESLEQTLYQSTDVPTPRYKVFEAFLALAKFKKYGPVSAQVRLLEFRRLWEEGVKQIWKEGVQLSLMKWQSLPPIVAQSHISLLHGFQQFQELDDSRLVFESLIITTEKDFDERSTVLRGFLDTWKERVPNDWDGMSLWGDLSAWRQHVFNEINRANFALHSSGMRNSSPEIFRGCLESKWMINRFARVARKQHLYDTCLKILSKYETVSGTIPLANVNTLDTSDIYTRINEMIQCHYDNPASDWEASNVIREKLPHFPPPKRATVFTLMGMFRDKAGEFDEANKAFASAVQEDKFLPAVWEHWGRHSERRFKKEPTNLPWAINAVSCYLQAAGICKNSKARKFFLRVLWLLSMDDQNDGNRATEIHKGDRPYWPHWYWVTLIPQLLQSLDQPEAKHAQVILKFIANQYPQALYFQLRTAYKQLQKKPAVQSISQSAPAPEDLSNGDSSTILKSEAEATVETSTDHVASDPVSEDTEMKDPEPTNEKATSPKALNSQEKKEGTPHQPEKHEGQTDKAEHPLEDVMTTLKTSHPLLALSMETMVDQIQLKFKPQPDEDMYRLIVALYNEGLQHLLSDLTTPNGSTEVTRNFGKSIVRFANSLPGHMKIAFMNDFARKELCLEENVAKLRLWRDKFEAMLDARPRRQKLETLSHYLVEFQHQKFDDVEIPGQYLLLKDNANDFLRIDRFLPEVDAIRSQGNYCRRLTIRGHDGSLHPFVIQNPAARQFRREERLMQLFRLLNDDLDRQKESRSRNLFFNLPVIVPLAPNLRMIQDDPTYCSLQGIYEDHCDAEQIHKDDPLVYYVESLQKRADQMEDLDLAKIKADTNEEIINTMVPSTIFSKFMLRTMDSYNDYWMLRKQFTLQYATATFMSYLFNIGDRTPHKIYVSRSTGSLWMAEMLPGWKQDSFDFESGEAVPFRMTPNIADFITPVGMDGLFKSSLMATAQSLTVAELDLEQSLGLFVRDEYVAWAQTHQHTQTNAKEVIRASVDKMVKKAVYLSCAAENKKDAKPSDQNVTELISQASNPHILADMGCTWMPWM